MSVFTIRSGGYIQAIDLNVGNMIRVDDCTYTIKSIFRDGSNTLVSICKNDHDQLAENSEACRVLSFGNSDYVEIYKFYFPCSI
jgi:hypothetical protein